MPSVPQDQTLTFDGTTECRGRNRWFQLREVEISHHTHNDSLWVYLFSSRRGGIAPIVLGFHSPDELYTLMDGLRRALKDYVPQPKETPHVQSDVSN